MKYIYVMLICLGTITCFAQKSKSGSIEGTIVDKQTQQPLTGTNIFIVGTSFGTTSDQYGKFVISYIPVGIYQLKASYIGYQIQVKTEVSILSNRVTMVNFNLNPEILESQETIEIQSDYFFKDCEKPVSRKSLTPMEIRSSAGSAEDIFRVLQSMPGVSSVGSKDANLIVRGGAPDENRTLLDNIEIYNPLHFARPGASMGVISIVNPALIQSVDFITGGFPVKYGDKLSSVFEMKLKEGNQSEFNTDCNLNLGGFGLLLDGPVSNTGKTIFSIRRGFFDLLTKMMNAPVIPHYWDAVGKVSFQLGNWHKVSLIGFYYLDDFTKDGIITDAGHADGMGNKYTYIKRDDFGSAFGLNWQVLFSKNGYMLTTAAYTSNGWNSHFGSDNDHRLASEEIIENEIHLKNEVNYKLSDYMELKGGIFYKSIHSDHDSYKEPDTTRTGFIFSANTIDFHPAVTYKLGSFIQSIFYPLSKLSFNFGVRYDYFDFIKEAKISPRISFNYFLTRKFSINAAYGYYYQTPATYQIALDEANTRLNNSRAIHKIVGIECLLNADTKISIEVYQKSLTSTFTSSDTSYVITNNGSGFSRGIELYIQKKMSEYFAGSFAYSYSVAKRRDLQYLPEYYFDFDQRHSITLISGYRLSKNWQIGIKFQYSTGMPYTPVVAAVLKDQNFYGIEGERNSARYPDFHKLDIRIDRYFRFNNWTLAVYMDIWNAYDRRNIIGYRYDIDKNGTIIREETKDFPMLPILGISAQF